MYFSLIKLAKTQKSDNILCELRGNSTSVYCRREGKMVQSPKEGDWAASGRDVDSETSVEGRMSE